MHASAAVCARRARRQRVRLLCERAPQVAGAVVARGGSSECCFGWPAAAALAQQSCRVAEAEYRNDFLCYYGQRWELYEALQAPRLRNPPL